MERSIKLLNRFLSQDSKTTAQFYNELLDGRKSRKIVGLKNRYTIENARQIEMVEEYFDPVFSQLLNSKSNLLDYGCGNGFFTKRLSAHCNSVTGVDISRAFINQALINKPKNSHFSVINPQLKSIKSKIKFNICLMVDVVHHLENPENDFEFLAKKFKSNDPIVIFEPNIKNPAIFFMHLFDKNERGLLRFMRTSAYTEMLKFYVKVESIAYNGILIGPANIVTNNIVRILNLRCLKHLFNWLNPKVLIIGRFK